MVTSALLAWEARRPRTGPTAAYFCSSDGAAIPYHASAYLRWVQRRAKLLLAPLASRGCWRRSSSPWRRLAASGTWSMEDMLWWPPGSPMEHLWGLGWYEEKYRREADGEWRIAHLKLRRIRVEVDGKEVGLGDRPASGDRTNTAD